MAKSAVFEGKRRVLRRHLEDWLADNGLEAYELRTLRVHVISRAALRSNQRAARGNEMADKVLTAQISRLSVGRHEVGRKCLEAVMGYLTTHGAMTIREFAERISVEELVSLSPKFGMAQLKLLNQALSELGYPPL